MRSIRFAVVGTNFISGNFVDAVRASGVAEQKIEVALFGKIEAMMIRAFGRVFYAIKRRAAPRTNDNIVHNTQKCK